MDLVSTPVTALIFLVSVQISCGQVDTIPEKVLLTCKKQSGLSDNQTTICSPGAKASFQRYTACLGEAEAACKEAGAGGGEVGSVVNETLFGAVLEVIDPCQSFLMTNLDIDNLCGSARHYADCLRDHIIDCETIGGDTNLTQVLSPVVERVTRPILATLAAEHGCQIPSLFAGKSDVQSSSRLYWARCGVTVREAEASGGAPMGGRVAIAVAGVLLGGIARFVPSM